ETTSSDHASKARPRRRLGVGAAFVACGRLIRACGKRSAAWLVPARARGSIQAASKGSGRASRSHGQANSNMRPPGFENARQPATNQAKQRIRIDTRLALVRAIKQRPSVTL